MLALADTAMRWTGIVLAILVCSVGAGALLQELGDWWGGEP